MIKPNSIIYGKSQEKLKDFPDNYFYSIVTDPPYEMGFMGKSWDASGIAYNVEFWKEALRVCKPGATLLCFGGSRTHFRVAVAIEDAGWILRDEIDWIYGEGFPKSTDIGKQLDKEQITKPATNDAKLWDGYGTALKPAHEPIIVAMKPLEKGLTFAQNARKWNVAGLNIDGCRIGTESTLRSRNDNEGSFGYKAVKRSLIGGSTQGRWPSNVILSHSPDCVKVGEKVINENAPEGGYFYKDKEYKVEGFIKDNKPQASSNRGRETIEVWACVPDCPVRIMDGQSGILKSGDIKSHKNKKSTFLASKEWIGYHKGDSGGVSRFFYCAKVKRSERELGCREFLPCVKCDSFTSKTHKVDGIKSDCIRNNHPTVKPIELMKYLCTLVKMPNQDQIILDPFCGSGSTLIAAKELGINYIGIDSDSDNVLIAEARVGAVRKENFEEENEIKNIPEINPEELSSKDMEDLL